MSKINSILDYQKIILSVILNTLQILVKFKKKIDNLRLKKKEKDLEKS